jgi:hypothetical protein
VTGYEVVTTEVTTLVVVVETCKLLTHEYEKVAKSSIANSELNGDRNNVFYFNSSISMS